MMHHRACRCDAAVGPTSACVRGRRVHRRRWSDAGQAQIVLTRPLMSSAVSDRPSSRRRSHSSCSCAGSHRRAQPLRAGQQGGQVQAEAGGQMVDGRERQRLHRLYKFLYAESSFVPTSAQGGRCINGPTSASRAQI